MPIEWVEQIFRFTYWRILKILDILNVGGSPRFSMRTLWKILEKKILQDESISNPSNVNENQPINHHNLFFSSRWSRFPTPQVHQKFCPILIFSSLGGEFLISCHFHCHIAITYMFMIFRWGSSNCSAGYPILFYHVLSYSIHSVPPTLCILALSMEKKKNNGQIHKRAGHLRLKRNPILWTATTPLRDGWSWSGSPADGFPSDCRWVNGDVFLASKVFQVVLVTFIL